MSAARTSDPFAHRSLRRGAGALLIAAVGLHVVRAATGFGGHGADDFFAQWLYDAVVAACAFACLLRAALVPVDRGAWLALGIGLTSWTAGEITWSLTYSSDATPPYPNVSDALYLLYYPCVYVAVALLVRRRRRIYRTGLWLDGLTGALAVAAIGAALVLPPILDDATGSAAAIATNLAYPLGDLLVLAFLAGGLIVSRGAADRGWLLLAAGVIVAAVVDCIYLYLVATGGYVEGGVLDSGWLVAVALLAFAAWQRPRFDTAPQSERTALLAPVLCAIVAVGLGAYGTLHGMPVAAAVLTTATLIGVVLRLALTLRENAGMLQVSREEASTDALTGLSNRRRLVIDLGRALAPAQPTPCTFALFDLDGFKQYNDAFGHPAG